MSRKPHNTGRYTPPISYVEGEEEKGRMGIVSEREREGADRDMITHCWSMSFVKLYVFIL